MKVKSMQRPGAKAIRTQIQTKANIAYARPNVYNNSKLNVRCVHGVDENYEGYILDLNASFSTISSYWEPLAKV